jgi:hypothetical protein
MLTSMRPPSNSKSIVWPPPLAEVGEVERRGIELDHLRLGAADHQHVVEHLRHALDAGAYAVEDFLLFFRRQALAVVLDQLGG